ncbi:4-amino-4-deoxy-L-arabinose transferase-like glycosyltransferase [Pedobacter sp. UYP24]
MIKQSLSEQKTRWLYLFIGLAVLVNFSGLFVTIIGPDGALYASIAKTMVVKNNFTDLFVEGRDWLDKPHFPFWMAAISFKIFGITTWAYKLPAIVFTMIGAVYTYMLAQSVYNKQIALWAVLILLTAEHIIISDMDVRAEPYLTGLIIGGIYHLYKAQSRPWFFHLLIGCVWAACAVMTKGIFALIPVFGAIAGPLVITKNWKMLFNFRWLLAVVFIFLMVIPELWCLYVQFDKHPEKIVFNQTGVSGIRFFFWDSQFGRFFNTGPIKKSGGDPSFFLHTILWAFLPWSILFYIAVVNFFRNKAQRLHEESWLCICGTILTLLVLSLSKFQLPHYIIIIFPFFSIITANYLCNITSPQAIKGINTTQKLVLTLIIILLLVVQFLFRADITFLCAMLLVLALALLIYISFTIKDHYRIFFQTAAVILLVNVYFNFSYYPSLTKYQGDSEAAIWLNSNNLSHLPVVKLVNNYAYAIDFYSDQVVHDYRFGEEKLLPAKPYFLYGQKEEVDELIKANPNIELVKTFDTYQITRMKLKFLNNASRKNAVSVGQLVIVR